MASSVSVSLPLSRNRLHFKVHRNSDKDTSWVNNYDLKTKQKITFESIVLLKYLLDYTYFLLHLTIYIFTPDANYSGVCECFEYDPMYTNMIKIKCTIINPEAEAHHWRENFSKLVNGEQANQNKGIFNQPIISCLAHGFSRDFPAFLCICY